MLLSTYLRAVIANDKSINFILLKLLLDIKFHMYLYTENKRISLELKLQFPIYYLLLYIDPSLIKYL